MVEASGDLDLTEETLGPYGGSEVLPQDFQGHLPVNLLVPDQVDGGHPPLPQFSKDRETASENRGVLV